jgi:hypothetical protein
MHLGREGLQWRAQQEKGLAGGDCSRSVACGRGAGASKGGATGRQAMSKQHPCLLASREIISLWLQMLWCRRRGRC